MQGLAPLFLGIGLGLILAMPVAWLWSRRGEQRAHRMAERARAAERLAEIGTMTSGLAHEIKNPLSTLNLNAQLLREDLDEVTRSLEPNAPPQLQRIDRRFDALARETQRLRDILEDFLRFAGRVRLDLQPVDLHQLIGQLADFYEPQARAAGVNLRLQCDAEASVLPADAALLKQALLNLLINATQAMSDAKQKPTQHGGASELILRTENQREEKQPTFVLHVIDTGPGIDPDVLPRLFEPYFSTKRGGTGLGLPTTRRIIEEHSGRITPHSAPGQGTDFTITFPVPQTT